MTPRSDGEAPEDPAAADPVGAVVEAFFVHRDLAPAAAPRLPTRRPRQPLRLPAIRGPG